MATLLKRLAWPVRVLIVIAALVPLATFSYPLWHYDFEAPQYPEGLAMSIWSYRLGGRVDLINGLNHYVGFMALHAEDFIEFKILPVAIVLVIITGLAVAVIGTFKALASWLVGYGLFGALAFADFYRWLYTFGTTVDPRAAISIEGYTPPMLGTSQFMNFYITSYPGVAAYLLVGSMLLGILAFVLARRGRLRTPTAQEAAARRASRRTTAAV